MEKKTYDELVEEVAALKRSCASYKSENTKLRARLQALLLETNNLHTSLNTLRDLANGYREELTMLQTRSWWERFKDLFSFD